MDMDKMRQEAIARMQEMQAKATLPNKPPNTNAPVNEKAQNKEPFQKNKEPQPPANESHEHINNTEDKQSRGEEKTGFAAALGLDFLDDLLKDKERILLLVLVYILGKEKADTGLILALLYLAL